MKVEAYLDEIKALLLVASHRFGVILDDTHGTEAEKVETGRSRQEHHELTSKPYKTSAAILIGMKCDQCECQKISEGWLP